MRSCQKLLAGRGTGALKVLNTYQFFFTFTVRRKHATINAKKNVYEINSNVHTSHESKTLPLRKNHIFIRIHELFADRDCEIARLTKGGLRAYPKIRTICVLFDGDGSVTEYYIRSGGAATRPRLEKCPIVLISIFNKFTITRRQTSSRLREEDLLLRSSHW